MALNLEDYFGEAINLGSRIMDITPSGQIFCTQEVQKILHTKVHSQYL
jgi:class 3 adenylate cyclase